MAGATFGYGRCSTVEQHVENQRLELENAGHQIEFWYADSGVSGKVPAKMRPQFAEMLRRIRDNERLVVSRLDRLGRDAIDVVQTLEHLASRQIQVYVLQLGAVDLSSPAGKLITTVLAAVSQLERDLLRERTMAGLARAKSEGKKLGRRPSTTAEQRAEILAKLDAGESPTDLAREYCISRPSVYDIRDGRVRPS